MHKNHISDELCEESLQKLFSRQGRCQRLRYKHLSFTWLSHWSFVKTSLQRRHALMVEHGAFSHKIDYVTIFLKIQNRKWHSNRITGKEFKHFICSIGWIFPIAEALVVEGLRSTWLPRLVFIVMNYHNLLFKFVWNPTFLFRLFSHFHYSQIFWLC